MVNFYGRPSKKNKKREKTKKFGKKTTKFFRQVDINLEKQKPKKFFESYLETNPRHIIMYMTGTETFFYEKKGTKMTLLKKISFFRQKKQNNGGQSQNRIARLRVEKIVHFSKKSLLVLDEYKNNTSYNTTIVAGNGSIIDVLKNKLSATFVKVSEHGMLSSKCNEVLKDMGKNSCDDKIDEYMDMVHRGDDLLVYGGKYIRENINQIKEIIIHKDSKHFRNFSKYKNKYVIHKGTLKGDVFLKDFEGIIGKLYYTNGYIE